MESFEPPLEIALAPEADQLLTEVKMLSNGRTGQANSGHEHQTQTLHQTVEKGSGLRQGVQ
jgi:hypothetical protein